MTKAGSSGVIQAVLGLTLATFATSCSPEVPEAPPSTVRIVEGGTGSVSYLLGEALAEVYARDLPGIEVSAAPGGGSRSHARAIDEGDAELGFVQADVAYLSFTGSPDGEEKPRTNLRGIATLFMNVMHLVARPESGISDFEDLAGKRVSVSQPESATRQTTEILLDGFEMSDAVVAEVVDNDQTLARLVDGSLDAVFLMISYPAPAVQDLVDSTAIRLVPVRGPTVERMLGDYPFLRPVVIPGEVYGYPDDVDTVGTNHLLVCSSDLSEDLVYDLTRILFDTLPGELAPIHEAFGRIDIEAAPATPIPLHPGAARFYREMELFR